MRYFVARELGIALLLQRYFDCKHRIGSALVTSVFSDRLVRDGKFIVDL